MQKHPVFTRSASPGTAIERFDSSTPGTHPLVLSSAAVLQGQKSVAIEHLGTIYRLQVTKLGKLILTK